MPSPGWQDSAGVVDLQAVIAGGQTASGAVDLKGRNLAGVYVPTPFTGTALKFQAAPTAADGTDTGATYYPVKNTDGTDLTLTVAAGTFVSLDPALLAGVRFLKVVSGSAEGGNRTLTLVAR